MLLLHARPRKGQCMQSNVLAIAGHSVHGLLCPTFPMACTILLCYLGFRCAWLGLGRRAGRGTEGGGLREGEGGRE